MNWLEVQRILKCEREEEICREQKAALLEEFKDIQKTLCDLVTKNLEGPENEKIDLVEFYLDTTTYNLRKAINKEECKTTETYLKSLIEAQDRVSTYLQKNYLDTMHAPGKAIKGIFQPTMATSFILLPPVPSVKSRFQWTEELRKVQQFINLTGSFEPWIQMTKE